MITQRMKHTACYTSLLVPFLPSSNMTLSHSRSSMPIEQTRIIYKKVFTIPDRVTLVPYKPLLLLQTTYSYIISIYPELARMFFTNLIIPLLLTTPGALATTPATSENPDTLNLLSFGWSPSPDYTCCVYLTTEPEWQGARTYGCIPPNRCSGYREPCPIIDHPLITWQTVFILDAFENGISSLGLDVAAGTCHLFE
jgi:hypothetical protein